MSRILTHFPARLIAITSQDGMDEDCLDLYQAAKNLPGPTTKGKVKDALGISVNGPINPAFPNVISAFDRDGVPLVVKLLSFGADLPFSLSQPARGIAVAAEIEACRSITGLKLDGLVHYRSETVIIDDHQGLAVGTGEWNALIAPRYVETVATAPQLEQAVLQRGYSRIKGALTLLHTNASLVHMDVKAGNIFIDSSGLWFLGDHGSCRPAMSPIFTASLELNPYELTFNKTLAHDSMDFVQLCVTIAMLLDIDTVSTLRAEDSTRVSPDRVEIKLQSIQDQSFRDEVLQDFRTNLTLVQDHLAQATELHSGQVGTRT